VCALCNDARIVFSNGQFDRIGEPTEAALSVLVEKLGAVGMERSSDNVVAASQFCDLWQGKYDKLATLEFK
ncbi:unnamed protein product, partial [Discosporangium mesarthrocarpum]